MKERKEKAEQLKREAKDKLGVTFVRASISGHTLLSLLVICHFKSCFLGFDQDGDNIQGMEGEVRTVMSGQDSDFLTATVMMPVVAADDEEEISLSLSL